MGDIRIDGQVRRTFIFPADIDTAFSYYENVEAIFGWLKHIHKIRSLADGHYRVVYQSVELGIYQVKIYCDLQVEANRQENTLRFLPSQIAPPISPEASLQSMSAQGFYSSQSTFHAEGEQTRIDYHLKLNAALPVPLSARLLIPSTVRDLIAQSVMYHRIDEIADGFIQKSVQSYLARSSQKLPQ